MILETKLEQLNNDELIYIGSKSAFFFIGTVKEFKERYYSIQMQWKNKFQAAVQSAENKVNAHMEKKPIEGLDKVDHVRNYFTGKLETIVTPYEKLKKDWDVHYINLNRSYETSKKNLEKFKPFMKRTVIESYHRIDPQDGTVIIIKGREVGNYWFLSDTKKTYIGEYDDEQDYDMD